MPVTDKEASRLATVETILSEYASGSESLDTVAKRHRCTGKSVRQWAVEHPSIGEVYARARLVSAGALEDAALDVANASTAESYQSDRIRIDTYKWAAAKRHPREYGDKVQHDSTVTIRNAVIMMPQEHIPDAVMEVVTPQALSSGEDVINAS